MKKLLIVGTNSVHTLNHIKLVEDWFDSILVVTNKPMDGLKHKQEVVDFSLRNPIKLLSGIKIIRALIDEFQPTVIHLQQAGTHAYMSVKAAKGLNIPIILSPWGSDILLSPKRGMMFRLMVKEIISAATYITSVSHNMAEVMRGLLPNKQLDVSIIRWAIDTDNIISAQKENIVYSNRLHEPLYRIDSILKAFAKLDSSWQLVIAGTGSLTNELKELAVALGIADRVSFIGWIDKATNFKNYAKARIYVSIPISDGMPVSVQEAMLHGCLPVLSDIAANHELVKNGVNGIIVDDVYTDFLNPAIKQDIDKMVSGNPDLIKEFASVEVCRKAHINLYQKATAQ